MNLETLLSLTAYAFVTSITPGPNNAMLFASGVNFGLKRTLPHILGVSIGFTLMQLALGLGVGLAFEAFPSLYSILRVAGVGYLLFLAWRIASSTPPPVAAPVPAAEPARSPANTQGRPRSTNARPMTFLQATAFQWVNPKALMMCITAAGAFTPKDHPTLGVLVICAVFLVVNFPCVGAWAALGTGLRGFLQDRTRLRVFNMGMALLLVASMAPLFRDMARDLALDMTGDMFRNGLF